MTATVKEPLGASTTNRKWYLDVNTGTSGAPVWLGVFGITEFKPTVDPNFEDDSDFDSEGAKSSTKTAYGWGVEAKLARKVTTDDATAYDPGQEFLRAKSDELGAANSVQIRFYEMEPGGPREEAYVGMVGVDWQPDGGPMTALSTVAVNLRGQGARTPIAHPDA